MKRETRTKLSKLKPYFSIVFFFAIVFQCVNPQLLYGIACFKRTLDYFKLTRTVFSIDC